MKPNLIRLNLITVLCFRILALKGSNRKGGDKVNLFHFQSKKKPAGAGLNCLAALACTGPEFLRYPSSVRSSRE